eukprot:gnl/Dysnectes_brevis/2975_a3665_1693.p1 GENE.gnl/Dysnectes_brevis/2975_a3665_1693~~gnl/Dysnectes_brevis/2975_a3665_1693.p1  ORF type:complete len:132 (+),score=0.11 gnl/Dysnectes_brevis/2975_a3665_1693:18-413(+)
MESSSSRRPSHLRHITLSQLLQHRSKGKYVAPICQFISEQTHLDGSTPLEPCDGFCESLSYIGSDGIEHVYPDISQTFTSGEDSLLYIDMSVSNGVSEPQSLPDTHPSPIVESIDHLSLLASEASPSHTQP